MAGYEKQEHSESAPFHAELFGKPRRSDEVDETKDLENLLNMSEPSLAQSERQAPASSTQEKPQ